jgi:hypothetical protein
MQQPRFTLSRRVDTEQCKSERLLVLIADVHSTAGFEAAGFLTTICSGGEVRPPLKLG